MMNLETPNYPTMSEDSLNWSDFDATGLRFAILVARFNSMITEKLLDGARKALEKGAPRYEVFHVPGAFELPFAAKMLAQTHRYHGIDCVGRGDSRRYSAFRLCCGGSGARIAGRRASDRHSRSRSAC